MPLLLSAGAGAKARFSMGLVIATGMSIGTVFTLFVVPMFYTFLSSRSRPVDRDAGTLAPPDAAPAE
jgi:multidrug efflux pump